MSISCYIFLCVLCWAECEQWWRSGQAQFPDDSGLKGRSGRAEILLQGRREGNRRQLQLPQNLHLSLLLGKKRRAPVQICFHHHHNLHGTLCSNQLQMKLSEFVVTLKVIVWIEAFCWCDGGSSSRRLSPVKHPAPPAPEPLIRLLPLPDSTAQHCNCTFPDCLALQWQGSGSIH